MVEIKERKREIAKAIHSNQGFAEEVMAEPGGEVLYRCYSCGTCASACLVRRVTPKFNPRHILKMVVLGMREEVLSSSVPWLCSACDICYQRCPQGIHISDLMKAIRNIAIREGYEPPGPTAVVDEALCAGCGTCVTACPYETVKLTTVSTSDEHMVAQVDRSLCMNCGICAAVCPSKAISVEKFSYEKIAVRMQAGGWFLEKRDEPKIMVFICNWCLQAEADLARLDQFPPNIRVVNTPCTGRVDPSLILTALREGADGVLVIGCQPGECHYQEGNLLARRGVLALKPFLEAIGVDGDRLKLEWISTSERRKVEKTVEEFLQGVKHLGPNPFNSARRQH